MASVRSVEANYVANFTGTDISQILIPDHESLRLADASTISFRFRTNLENTNILGKSGEYYFSIIDKKLYAYANTGEVWISAVSDIKLGVWHHVAAVLTYNESETSYQFKLYIDGLESSSQEIYKYGDFSSAHEPLIIGSFMRLEPFYIGALDDVCIHRKALDKLAIMHLAERGPDMGDPSLGLYLDYDLQNLKDKSIYSHLVKENADISYTNRL